MYPRAVRFTVAFGLCLAAALTWQLPGSAQQRMFGAVSSNNNQVIMGQNGQQEYVTAGGQAVPLPGNGVIGTQVQIYTGMMGKQWYVDRTGAKVFLPPPPATPVGAVQQPAAQQPTVINNNAPQRPGILPIPIPIPMAGYGQQPYTSGMPPVNINAPVTINPPYGTVPAATTTAPTAPPSYPSGSVPYNSNTMQPNTMNSMQQNSMHPNTMPSTMQPNSAASMPYSRHHGRFGAAPATNPTQPMNTHTTFQTPPVAQPAAQTAGRRRFGRSSAAAVAPGAVRPAAASAATAGKKRHWVRN